MASTTLQTVYLQDTCMGRRGLPIATGDWFYPREHVPCYRCLCQAGNITRCHMQKCSPPKCISSESPNECCRCITDLKNITTLPPAPDTSGRMVAVGMRLVGGTVSVVLFVALLLFILYRLRHRRFASLFRCFGERRSAAPPHDQFSVYMNSGVWPEPPPPYTPPKLPGYRDQPPPYQSQPPSEASIEVSVPQWPQPNLQTFESPAQVVCVLHGICSSCASPCNPDVRSSTRPLSVHSTRVHIRTRPCTCRPLSVCNQPELPARTPLHCSDEVVRSGRPRSGVFAAGLFHGFGRAEVRPRLDRMCVSTCDDSDSSAFDSPRIRYNRVSEEPSDVDDSARVPLMTSTLRQSPVTADVFTSDDLAAESRDTQQETATADCDPAGVGRSRLSDSRRAACYSSWESSLCTAHERSHESRASSHTDLRPEALWPVTDVYRMSAGIRRSRHPTSRRASPRCRIKQYGFIDVPDDSDPGAETGTPPSDLDVTRL